MQLSPLYSKRRSTKATHQRIDVAPPSRITESHQNWKHKGRITYSVTQEFDMKAVDVGKRHTWRRRGRSGSGYGTNTQKVSNIITRQKSKQNPNTHLACDSHTSGCRSHKGPATLLRSPQTPRTCTRDTQHALAATFLLLLMVHTHKKSTLNFSVKRRLATHRRAINKQATKQTYWVAWK